MADFNKVILSGRIAQNAELRRTPAGHAVANFTIATDDYRGKDQPKGTQWTRCVLWGRAAEALGPCLVKGAPVAVEGKLKTRQWQDKNGLNRETMEVEVQNIIPPQRRDRDAGASPEGQWDGQDAEGGSTNDDLPY